MKKTSIYYLYIASVCLSQNSAAQCLGFGSITANDKCIFVEWSSMPSFIPDSMRLLSSPANLYRKKSSSSLGSSPFLATYRNSASGVGACNASASDIPISDSIMFYTTKTEGGIDSIKCIFTVGVLPINLISFKAENAFGKTQLFWEVGNGEWLSHFIVEEDKLNGQGFVPLKTIDFQEGQYTYTFDIPLNKNNHSLYRLKISNWEGENLWTKAILVKNTETQNDFEEPNVFPNPANTQISVQINNKALQHSSILLKSIDGRQLNSFPIGTLSVLNIPIEALLPGMYLLQFQHGKTIRFYKQ